MVRNMWLFGTGEHKIQAKIVLYIKNMNAARSEF